MDGQVQNQFEGMGNMVSAKSSEHVRVRYRFGDSEFEGDGPSDEINRHVMAFFAVVSKQKDQYHEVISPQQLSLFDEVDAPLLADNGASSTSSHTPIINRGDDNLLSFYLEKAFDPSTNSNVATQTQQLLLITYFLQKKQHQEKVCLEEYRQAYSVLDQVPVKEPTNITARLGELCKQGHIAKREGGYIITFKGERIVEAMARAS